MKITNEEYAELVRQSERLALIESLIEGENYISTGTIKAILGIKDKEDN